MPQMPHVATSKLGNTKPVCKGRKWCLTVNNYTEEEYTEMISTFTMKNWLHIVGKEGATDATPHLQVYIECKSTIRFCTLKKLFPRAHIEKAKGNKEQNLKYCMKEGDFASNMKLPHVPKPVLDPLEGRELYPFQKDILELIKTPPGDRLIHWYWDNVGCKGKTTLAKHIRMNHNAVYVQGKAADIKHGVIERIKLMGEVDIVMMGLPRTYETFVSYDAIESCKDGMFFSGKYESQDCVFNPPHVIIFANFPPQIDKLSADRWVITRLDEPEDIETEKESNAQLLYGPHQLTLDK